MAKRERVGELVRRGLGYSYLCTVHNVLDACISISWASGRGMGPGNLNFFGPQMALAYWLDAISLCPKNAQFPGPNPLPLALAMDMHASIT